MKLPQQNFKVAPSNKLKFGDVRTDFNIIRQMIDMMPPKFFQNTSLRILDPTCGNGYFSMILFQTLDKELNIIIPDKEKRKKHILQNMLFMVELNPHYIQPLKHYFGKHANIYNQNFLSFTTKPFDLIIGNPPYNSKGIKKVPTNTTHNKKKDGHTVWPAFLRHSITLLKDKGFLNMIIPVIWMKPDKERTYQFMLQYHLHKIRCFSNTETKKLFHGHAQTPTCYFLLQKTHHFHNVSLFDPIYNSYKIWHIQQPQPIPLLGVSILNKLKKHLLTAGPLKIIKTNLPSKNTIISTQKTSNTPYHNIKTCIIQHQQPTLVINYSNKPLPFHNTPKLILAHKMYGFPYIDYEGTYGISNRDNYVIINRTHNHLKLLAAFLSTTLCRYLFEATRYRMKYLEKYIFQLLPDITKLKHFPHVINNNSIFSYFELNHKERTFIQQRHKIEKWHSTYAIL